MKQNIFIAALLAGMLALAGCGGGSSATPEEETETMTETAAETISAAIAECADDACVEGEIAKAEADDSGVSDEELEDLKVEAEARKEAIAATAGDKPLAGNELAAANQLADALAGSEALELSSLHVDPKTGDTLGNVDWKKHSEVPSLSGWTGSGYREANPEGSSGEEQDLRIWTENPKYISEKYTVFFTGTDDGSGAVAATLAARGISAYNTQEGSEGHLTLLGLDTLTAKQKSALPSNFFTASFTRTGSTANWELPGSFHGVPGKFVCPSESCTALSNTNNLRAQPLTITSTLADIVFQPSAFEADKTHVPAQFAEKANPNFLSFGSYWSTVLNDDGDVTAISADPFAGGGVAYSGISNIVQSGSGNLTATYRGRAAGVYVTTVEDDNEDNVPTGYGEFTANANFTAKFGTTSDTVYGTISNFARIAGTGAGDGPGDWTVNAGTAAKPLSIEDNGSVTNTDASFHGQFQGQVAATRQSNGHGYAPYGLVGTFQDSFDDGHATGAFGTECRGGNCTKQN